MEGQPTKLDKAVKISIIVGALIIGLSVAYYLVLYIPKRDKAKLEQQAQQAEQQKQEQQTKDEALKKAEDEKNANKILLDDCLSTAQADYTLNWTEDCKANAKRVSNGIANCKTIGNSDSFCRSLWGSADASPNCSLPLDLSKSIEDSLTQQKNDCFKKYPQ